MRRAALLIVFAASILVIANIMPSTAQIDCPPGILYVTEGDRARRDGNLEAALYNFTCALPLNAGNDARQAIIHNQRGNIYRLQREYQRALLDYDRAITLDNTSAITYNNRGWTHYLLGNYDAALADLNQALALDPQLAFAYNNRGLLNRRLGNFEAAVFDFTRAIELEHNPEVWPETNLALLEVESGLDTNALVNASTLPSTPAANTAIAAAPTEQDTAVPSPQVDTFMTSTPLSTLPPTATLTVSPTTSEGTSIAAAPEITQTQLATEPPASPIPTNTDAPTQPPASPILTNTDAPTQPPASPIPTNTIAPTQPPASPIPTNTDAPTQLPASPIPTNTDAPTQPPASPIPTNTDAPTQPPASPIPTNTVVPTEPTASPIPTNTDAPTQPPASPIPTNTDAPTQPPASPVPTNTVAPTQPPASPIPTNTTVPTATLTPVVTQPPLAEGAPVDEVFDSGFQAYETGDFARAVDEYSKVIEEQAESIYTNDAYYNRALAYSALGMPEEAIADFSVLVEEGIAGSSVYLNRGIQHLALGDREAAAQDFNQYVNRLSTTFFNRGELVQGEPVIVELAQGRVYSYTFEAAAFIPVIISVTGGEGEDTALDPLVLVLDGNGVPLSADDDDGENFSALLSFSPPQTGTYTLLVSHAGAEKYGFVEISIGSAAVRSTDG